MASFDNANPTILSASQLPTRQKKAAPRKGPELKYNDVIFEKPTYLLCPFAEHEAAWARGTDWDNQLAAEAIDEQEIYGEILLDVIYLLCFSKLLASTFRIPKHVMETRTTAFQIIALT